MSQFIDRVLPPNVQFSLSVRRLILEGRTASCAAITGKRLQPARAIPSVTRVGTQATPTDVNSSNSHLTIPCPNKTDWADDPMFRRIEVVPPTPSQRSANSSTPGPSQRARAEAARGGTAPQSSPEKRGSSSSFHPAPETPSKRKRLEDIQAGLTGRNGIIPALGPSAASSTPGPARQLQTTQSRGLATPQASPQKKGPSPVLSGPETPSRRKHFEDTDAGVRSARGTDTLQRNPQNQSSSSQLSAPESPSKRKRLEAIEAGLKGRDEAQPSARAGPSNHSTAAAGPSLSLSSSSHVQNQDPPVTVPPSSQASTEVDWEEVLPPATPTHQNYSFLGLNLSQDSNASVVEPSTPRRTRPSPSGDGNDNDAPNVGVSNPGMLLTPPQTTHRHSGPTHAGYSYDSEGPNGSSRPEPGTPTRHKGKERSINPHWERIVEDEEENPFIEDSSAGRLAAQEQEGCGLPPLRRTPRLSLGSDGSPTSAELITAGLLGMKEPIQTLQAYMDSFEQLGAVKHIEKLERQNKALALGGEAKTKRIAELSTQLDTVNERLRQSEENGRVKDGIIAALKARKPL
ncbi:hypothetical protein HYDPIDRAFT_165747 [Hydnomerulius pinastri MD-312]|nr:hypothetical protein HYDPIDRAFT_165747 [Hydnomerulius pinastri MD-312]